jgi:2-succinyl-6-hydroxy-2,4-cyclohexadiene-1-carboxylate synthase
VHVSRRGHGRANATVAVVGDLVALHGFAGTGGGWDAVAAELGTAWSVWAPDLPGHGAASGRRPVTLAASVDDVLAGAPERFVLAGYSQGGRIALRVALAAPARVEGLVLVSTTAGIEDPAERAARRAADEELAAVVEQGTIDDFVTRWTAEPLLADTTPAARAAWEADIRRNEPGGLAAALRGIGTGSTAPLWDRLGELDMPAVVVVGERDDRYRALGARLAAALPGAGPPVVVPAAGHAVVREAPGAVAGVIASVRGRVAR